MTVNTTTQKPESILTIPQLVGLLDELLPLKNKDDCERYGDLLEDLFHFSFNTRNELLRIFKAHRDLILKYEYEMATYRKSQSMPGGPEAMEIFENKLRLARGVYFTHTGLVRLMLAEELGEQWSKYTCSPEWRAREIETDEF